MSASLVAAYLYELFLDDSQNGESLMARASLKKFLTEIVAIVVNHQVTKVFFNLFKEESDYLIRSFVELFL